MVSLAFHAYHTVRVIGVNVMDIPIWRMRIQVRINIIVFVKIMDYSSVF
jgi:hypothetical protein